MVRAAHPLLWQRLNGSPEIPKWEFILHRQLSCHIINIVISLIVIRFCAKDWNDTLVNTMLNNKAQPGLERGFIQFYVVCFIGSQ